MPIPHPLFITFLLFLTSQTSYAQIQNQTTSTSTSEFPWTPSENRFLVSNNSVFSAGFLPSPNSRNHFIFSIFYNNMSETTTIWSVNDDAPVNRSSSLSITGSGELRLAGIQIPGTPTLSGNATRVLRLNDNGNLAFGNWNSFSHPTNTILPNQNINGTTLSVKNGTFQFTGKDLIFTGSYEQATYYQSALPELCRVKGTCGPNSICMYGDTYDTTVCRCPPGFERNSGGEGCRRKVTIGRDSKFLQLDYVNFSGGSDPGSQTNIDAWNFTICQSGCLNDPECVGFGYKYDGQRYCVLVRKLYYGLWSPATEATFFLRVDKSERDTTNFTGLTSILETTCPVQVSLPFPPEESSSTARNIAIISTLFAAELISGVAFFWVFLKKYLKAATNDFSSVVGKGGFGDVYKGVLTDHRIVAVKCLKNVTSGDNEFWAEVTIIARMHHLNLVRLWGFCAEKGQRILVYEYVPNGSLDKFLFHSNKFEYSDGDYVDEDVDESRLLDRKPVLDWGIRYRIALGIARAIAYLHEECLEWVLHCDIKPENILIGADFCPKLSDFGLSKLRKKEDMVSYSKMCGTRGYMAPEWLKSDQITPKADVYSFGMVLLEIVTGVRNCNIQGSKMDSEDWYFPRWAFDKVYGEMDIEDILDKEIRRSYDSRVHEDMITRMVKTAIWCLQDRPEMRPSMGKVAKMIEGTVEIMEPKKPTIFFLGD
ncbi:putative protein kinase RLK-Pelle-SD-2b family [Helianthus annuus]|nr:putative protein kinase RLK-Pelle-SD-2b family [Helianthus annuus]